MQIKGHQTSVYKKKLKAARRFETACHNKDKVKYLMISLDCLWLAYSRKTSNYYENKFKTSAISTRLITERSTSVVF